MRSSSEVFLPELKLDLFRRDLPAGGLDLSRGDVGTAEVHSDLGGQRPLEAGYVRLVDDPVPHGAEEALEVGAAEIGTALEFRQRVNVCSDGVEVDVGRRVLIETLCQVRVDAQELRAALGRSRGGGLRLKRGEQSLKPFERGGVLADPDEFDTAQSLRWVGARTQVPDVLEDGGPRRHTDTGSDQHGDFVLEDILGGCSVRAVDAKSRHLLPVLQGDFIHAHGIKGLQFLCLGRTTTQSITKCASEVPDLSDVNTDIWIKGARGDGKGMPLRVRDLRALQEEPLASFVLHAGLPELDLHRIYYIVRDKKNE